MSVDPQAMPDGKALRDEANKWLKRIDKAAADEKTWMDNASQAMNVFTGEGEQAATANTPASSPFDFNILFSNVETIVPAIINSAPAPDIRRRFGQDDPIARDFAEILERTIRVQVDDGRLQIEMEGMAQDAFLAGRGIIRLRFQSDFETVDGALLPQADASAQAVSEAETEEALDSQNPDVAAEAVGDAISSTMEQSAPVERAKNERIGFEAVSWRDFRRGPAKRWADVPWIAFRHSIEPEDYDGFADKAFLDVQKTNEDVKLPEDEDRVVWEVWEKKSRSVIFVGADESKLIKRVPDPFGLTRFFPTHDPVQAITVNGRLMPVNPFAIYRKLADELDIATKRIRALTKQLKVKGWYAGESTDIQAVLDADDNQFVPISDPQLWAGNGGVAGAIAFWPVEKLVAVLQQLYLLRDQTKQAIYEITGISDIVRGATHSGETATAQQIKTQWGSLRIQRMQRAMERAARDLFVMMAEIIPAKFSIETLENITGIDIAPKPGDEQPVALPIQDGSPQAQQALVAAQAEEQARQQRVARFMQLQAMMREKATTFYRIDVETDSTVKADLTRQKSEATDFMQAAGAYFTAVAPLVQQGTLPMNIAVEIFGSFSRLFNLGKSVEDALDELIQKAKDQAQQPPQPSPQDQAEQDDADAKRSANAASVEKDRLDIEGRQIANQSAVTKARSEGNVAALDLQGRQADLTVKQNAAIASGIDLQIKQAHLRSALLGAPLQSTL